MGVGMDLISQSAEYVDRFATQIVNGAGHNPHQEQPDFVNKLIARFIKGEEDKKANQADHYNRRVKIPETAPIKRIQVAEEQNNIAVSSSAQNEESLYRTPVKKVMEYGTNMVNAYKAPVDKALESSSNLVSSGITSITNRVTKFPVIEQYVPWLSQDEEEML